MKKTLSIKPILIDFIYIKEQVKELFKDKIEYQSIIEFIHAKDYLDIPFPKQKEVEEETGVTLFEVVDNSQMHLDLNVYEKDLETISVGQEVDLY